MKIIGIDTGAITGVAVWHSEQKRFEFIGSMPIHRAMKFVSESRPDLVRVEDARKRKWFGSSGREKLQGAGSVKRDAKIWEDFLTDEFISFEMVAPKQNRTKLTAEHFKQITGWAKPTNEHSRDAAMLIFEYIYNL